MKLILFYRWLGYDSARFIKFNLILLLANRIFVVKMQKLTKNPVFSMFYQMNIFHSKYVRLIFLSAVILCSIAPYSRAIEVTDLYQAKVDIADQTRQSRNAAQKAAFAKVLVKVSGNEAVLENGAVKSAIRKASSYVRKFEFLRDEDDEQLIEVKFDEGKINRLLRQEQLPIWGKRRPAVLLWMAGEDAETLSRHIVTDKSYSHLLKQMQQISQNRGLPLFFPAYQAPAEQSEQPQVTVSDVWGYFYQHIAQHSENYEHDVILIARFYHSDEEEQPTDEQTIESTEQDLASQANMEDANWVLEWRIFEPDKKIEVNSDRGHLSELLSNLVEQLADKYAQEYAVNSSNLADAERMVLTVRNVSKIEHLISAEKLLMSFSAVADVMLKRLNNDVAEFEITLVGKPLDLIQGLELEDRFEQIFDPFSNDGKQQATEFKWVP